ncbi:MAG: hypothetical protein A2W01_05235 [Candidatus Solincola sediminis]|uniref:Uncharacterized protein n=1 Tax=Candidatus Solincola sediminis TaxID=1797199 RepID=A0A1F2WF80_9ACTN|nr:MAG: hypothetical protein A2Y75_09250 [Candidatus Solincola sediminis]OFW57818.1 MAG: hypothetical protein A2W01_05235 [Candidatus Solincola sediminis]
MNSGAIVQSNNTFRRIGFVDSDNLDPLYKGIAAIIGFSIDHLVMDISRRGTLDYGKNLLTPEVLALLKAKAFGLEMVIQGMHYVAQSNGLGEHELVEIKEDYSVIRIKKPFSVPLVLGTVIGGFEVVSEQRYGATYKEVEPEVFEVITSPSGDREEFTKRIPIKAYIHKEGDIEFARCPTCGGPKALMDFDWGLDRGLIVNKRTQKRMVVMGPEIQDPLFAELEKELGESIPEVVIAVQEDLVKSGFHSMPDLENVDDFRTQLALRGIGNMQEMKSRPKGLTMRIENSSCHLMVIGMMKGLFDKTYDVASHAEWEISADGELRFEITPER